MTRTNALRALLVASLVAVFAVAPAAASEGYESVNAITGPLHSSEDRGYESVNAITGPLAEPSSAAGSAEEYTSVNALLGPPGPAPASFVGIGEPGGFDWGDALIGALFGTALALVALRGGRRIGQVMRRTATSSA